MRGERAARVEAWGGAGRSGAERCVARMPLRALRAPRPPRPAPFHMAAVLGEETDMEPGWDLEAVRGGSGAAVGRARPGRARSAGRRIAASTSRCQVQCSAVQCGAVQCGAARSEVTIGGSQSSRYGNAGAGRSSDVLKTIDALWLEAAAAEGRALGSSPWTPASGQPSAQPSPPWGGHWRGSWHRDELESDWDRIGSVR